MGCEWLNTGGRWIPHTLVSQCGCSLIPCVATAGSGLWCRLQLHSALLAAWCSWDGRRWAEVGTGHEDGESTKAASWQGACCLLQGPYHSKLEPVPRDMQPWSWVAKDNYGWKESCVFVWEGLGGHRRKWMKYEESSMNGPTKDEVGLEDSFPPSPQCFITRKQWSVLTHGQIHFSAEKRCLCSKVLVLFSEPLWMWVSFFLCPSKLRRNRLCWRARWSNYCFLICAGELYHSTAYSTFNFFFPWGRGLEKMK